MTLPADRIYLFDTSIWIRTKHPLITTDWAAALRRNQLAVSPIVAFEVLCNARNQGSAKCLASRVAGSPRPDRFRSRRAGHRSAGRPRARIPDGGAVRLWALPIGAQRA